MKKMVLPSLIFPLLLSSHAFSQGDDHTFTLSAIYDDGSTLQAEYDDIFDGVIDGLCSSGDCLVSSLSFTRGSSSGWNQISFGLESISNLLSFEITNLLTPEFGLGFLDPPPYPGDYDSLGLSQTELFAANVFCSQAGADGSCVTIRVDSNFSSDFVSASIEPVEVNRVPVPSSIALFGIGLAWLSAFKRRGTG